MKDHHGGAGIIFTAKRQFFKVGKRKVKNIPERGDDTKRRKIGGELRNSVHTLKRWRVYLAKIDVHCCIL